MENYTYEMNDAHEISVVEILKIFKRSLLKILLVALACGLVSFAYFNFFVPKSYTTSLKLYVESSSSGDDAANYNYSTSLVNSYIQMLSTNSFYEKLSVNLGEKYSAKELSGMVKFASDGETRTDVFSVTVTAKSPMEAKTIADSVGDNAPIVMSSLKNDGASLKIFDNAAIPSSPSAPDVMKNTLIAMGAGAVVMIIIIFIREVLNNKIRFSDDATEIDGLPILSAVPDFGNNGFILSAVTETQPKEGEA